MPIKIPGVGLPPNYKRSTPESFDTIPTKKAKNEDGYTAGETKDLEAEPVSTGDESVHHGEIVKSDESEMSATGDSLKDSPMHGEDVKLKESQLTSSEPKPIETQQDGDETKPIECLSNTVDLQVNESKESRKEEDKPVIEAEMTGEQVTPKKPPKGYLMNVNAALIESHHGTPLRKIINLPVTALNGINEEKAKVLDEFKVNTIRDLANWKFYQIAKSIQALAEVEEEDGRLETSLQNINDAVDKKFEKRLLSKIMIQKAEVLQGVGKYLQGQLSKILGITMMEDLANFKPAKYAAALVALADYETTGFESKTTPDDSRPLSTFRPVTG